MALIDCPSCGTRVSRKAAACPKCGHPINPPRKKDKGFRIGGCGGCLTLVVVLGVLIAVLSETDTLSRETRYTWTTVNVREGRGTSTSVVEVLPAGQRVQVADLQNGWWIAYVDGVQIGYIANSVLHDGPRYVRAGGNLWIGVKLYYGPAKMYVGEVLGGNENYVSPLTGTRFRGVKVMMSNGSEEWKDRDAIASGEWYVLSDDPAHERMEWRTYEF